MYPAAKQERCPCRAITPDTAWSVIDTASLADEAALVAPPDRRGRAWTPPPAPASPPPGPTSSRRIRASAKPGLMEVFLAEYGLSTDEGIALMCLAEALLRVPDAETMDALIEDKIAPSDWGRHLGKSASSLVNASTWALMLTGKVLEDREPGVVGHLRAAVKRLGEPVIRTAVTRAMKEMGRNFVLGETIDVAMDRATGTGSQGLYLQLRHAGRGRPHRSRRPPLSPDLFPRDHRHRRAPPSAATSAPTPAFRSSSRPCTRATRSPSATA